MGAPGATDAEPGPETGEEQPMSESPTALADTPAPETTEATEVPGPFAGGAAADALADPQPGVIAPAPGPAPVRRPTKFLADLTKAMQAAAEAARAASLEQFQAEGKSFVEQVQARSATEAQDLRRRADEDVAGIRDWSKAEIARIREETDLRVAARRGQLAGQLERHAAHIEREIEKVRSRIAGYEAEMERFFDELLGEGDPTAFAARAAQLPEPPAFEDIDLSALAEAPGEPPVAAAPEPEVTAPAAEVEAVAVAGESETETEPVVETADEPTAHVEPGSGDTEPAMEREAAMAAIQAAAEAAAALEAADTDAGPPVPEIDPRVVLLGLTPDYAAAEAAAISEASDAYEIGEEALSARLGGLVPDASAPVHAVAPVAAAVATTQVVVVGLVSVTSIASFKRHLGRLAGVRRVGVSSGPDGEFVFSVDHERGTALHELIPMLPGFAARVTGTGEGIVNVAAHDPDN